MRKFMLLLISVVIVTPAALGDTIHLKNGSVLKGKVTSFADDQFIVMLDTGSGRYLSKAMVYMGDVVRIETRRSTKTGRVTKARRIVIAKIKKAEERFFGYKRNNSTRNSTRSSAK